MRLLRPFLQSIRTLIWLPALLTISASLLGNELNEEDRALIENRAALARTLTGADSVAYARAESMIREGHRTIQSGEFLAEAQATQMNPRRDVAGDRRRGQAMIKEGQEQVARGQAQMLALLRRASEQAASVQAAESAELVMDIPQAALDDYLAKNASEFIDRILGQGFDRIFFDEVIVHRVDERFVHDGLRRKIYDAFLDADGDRFAVGRAFETELAFIDNGDDSRPVLRFSDQPEGRVALMAVEVFHLEDASALLSLRAFSLDDWTMAEAALVALTNFPVPSDEHASLEYEEKTDPETENGTTFSVTLVTQDGVISRFEDLAEPYTFAIHNGAGEDRPDAMKTLSLRLLSHLLKDETELILSETPFVRQNYPLQSAVGTVSWNGPHNAVLLASFDESEPKVIEVTARARGVSGEVSVGQFSVPFDPIPTRSESDENGD